MGLITYGANAVLDAMLGTNHSSVFPNTVYISLYTTPPNTAGTGGVEVSGTGYERVAVVNDNTKWLAASGGQKSNAAAITFPEATASWGTVTHFGICTAATSGNIIYVGELSLSVTVNIGATPFFEIGSLVITAE